MIAINTDVVVGNAVRVGWRGRTNCFQRRQNSNRCFLVRSSNDRCKSIFVDPRSIAQWVTKLIPCANGRMKIFSRCRGLMVLIREDQLIWLMQQACVEHGWLWFTGAKFILQLLVVVQESANNALRVMRRRGGVEDGLVQSMPLSTMIPIKAEWREAERRSMEKQKKNAKKERDMCTIVWKSGRTRLIDS